MLIAPLSANTMAKLACGFADNLLVTLARAWWFPTNEKPVYFAPAMNTSMWDHPITFDHISYLKQKLKWKCIDPIEKTLICGDQGFGAMAEVHQIVDYLKSDYLDK